MSNLPEPSKYDYMIREFWEQQNIIKSVALKLQRAGVHPVVQPVLDALKIAYDKLDTAIDQSGSQRVYNLVAAMDEVEQALNESSARTKNKK